MKTCNPSVSGKERLRGNLSVFTQWLTFVRVLFSLMVIGGTVIGCGWFGPAGSVRFNDFLKGHDFFRLPPLPKAINPATGKPVRWYDSISDADADETAGEKTAGYETQVARAWREAAAAGQAGEWKKMRQRLRDYLKLTDGSGVSSDRNSAIDRLDALRSLDQGAGDAALRAWLAARKAYEQWDGTPDTDQAVSLNPLPQPSPAQTLIRRQVADLRKLIAAASTDLHLKDNSDYLRAAVLYREGKLDEAAQAFNQLAVNYPHSEKREAALFMAAVLTMKQSSSFTEDGSGTIYYRPDSPPTDLSSRRDEAWKAAQQAFQRQLREYPRGRFQSDARGWMAFLHRQVGNRTSALVEYYRMLAKEQDLNGRLEAVHSLTFIRHQATAEEMDRVEATLSDEPAAALAYAYHNLYNHAYAVEPTWWVFDDDSKEVKERRAGARDERHRIIAFATRLLQRYPQRSLSGAFALRIAQGNLELGEYKAALDFARRSLTLGLTSEDRLQALWVRGAAERYLRDYPAARRSLTPLISADAAGKLTEGARRMLAIVEEESGDLNAALEQYLALDYRYDVGYFVDVLMTPEQLAGFIERHPNHEKRDELLYALGVRYLREHRWNELRATLAQVKTTPGRLISNYGYYIPNSDPINPKTPWKTDTESPGVREEWVLRDLQTASELEARERAVSMSPDDETRAETMYQMASWLYQYSTLLFYNPKAWRGNRQWLIPRSDEAYQSPNESRLLWEYSQKHEPAAQALTIFLEIAERYPKTRAARDAFFTAAVCHERLADYNRYWRAMYQIGLHAGERIVTVRDVKRAYPDFRLPRTRLGWEPVTRTINGGPAWDPLPKPKPRLSFSTRVKIKIARLWESGRQSAVGAWEETVWPALLNVFYAVCLVIGAYLVFVMVVLYRQRRAASLPDELISLNLQADAAEAKEGSPVERIISQP
jgi:TolA-binding protein